MNKLNDENITRSVFNPHLLGIFGNIWFRLIKLDKDYKTCFEIHDYRHITIVCAGSFIAMVDGKEDRIYKVGDVCLFEKSVDHAFKGVEDNTLLCTVAVVCDDDLNPITFDDCMKLPSHVPQFYPGDIHPNFFV